MRFSCNDFRLSLHAITWCVHVMAENPPFKVLPDDVRARLRPLDEFWRTLIRSGVQYVELRIGDVSRLDEAALTLTLDAFDVQLTMLECFFEQMERSPGKMAVVTGLCLEELEALIDRIRVFAGRESFADARLVRHLTKGWYSLDNCFVFRGVITIWDDGRGCILQVLDDDHERAERTREYLARRGSVCASKKEVAALAEQRKWKKWNPAMI